MVPTAMLTLHSLRPLICATILLGTLFAAGAHANMAQDPALPFLQTEILLVRQSVVALPEPGLGAPPQWDDWNPAARAPLLSSNLDIVPNEPAPPHSNAADSM